MGPEGHISNIPVLFDHHFEPAQILPRSGYSIVARGQTTKERHPGIENVVEPPSAQEYLKERLPEIGRKDEKVES
jgi:hypothetical protein